MRRFLLVGLVLSALLFAGCDSDVFLRVDIPIVVKPAPRYRAEVSGYVSYDYWTRHVKLTDGYNYGRYYEPLSEAKITVRETGQVTYTDRNGYFHLRGVPYGWVTLVVEHRRIREKVSFSARSY